MNNESPLKKQANLTAEQRKMLSTRRVSMPVSLFEAAIIHEIRNIGYGQVQIHIIEHVPHRFHILDAGFIVDPTSDIDLLQKLANNEDKE